jgi:hypothetical protein
MKKSELRQLIREEISKLNEGNGGIWKSNNELYTDSDFINKSKSKLPNSELKHLGYGDFMLVTPDGDVIFTRVDGKKFNDQSGRVHKMVDTTKGKAISKLIKAMSVKIKDA